MKQKNILLMVVAVGCGLVAALLTSQMSAKPKVEMADVIVAAKDLPVGTFLTKEDLPKYVKNKKIPKEALPQVYVMSMEEMEGKRLGRAVRAEETFNPLDLKIGGTVTLPAGMDMMSVAVSLSDAVAGFVTPGSRVDILATARGGNRQVAFPLLVDMLVLAVDAHTQLPEQQASFGALNTVSLAVDRKQALLLQLARTRGCSLSLVLRNTDKHKFEETWKVEDVERLLQNPDWKEGDGIAPGTAPRNKEDGGEGKELPKIKETKPETFKMPVAKEDIAAGTELTIDVIQQKFDIKDVSGPVPSNAVLNLEAMQGRFLQSPLVADQWLPKSYVSDYAPGKEVPKHTFEPKPIETPEPVKPPVASGPPKKTHDVVVATGTGHRTFRYEEKTPNSGDWVLVGEVVKASEQLNPTPIPAPIPDNKPEPKPEPLSPSPKQD